MLRKFLAAAVLLLLPALSHATIYHVRGNGSDFNLGTSYANAWKTVAKADQSARPGDIIYVWAPATSPTAYYNYTFPNPDSGGSNPTGFITYIGASLYGDPVADSTVRHNIRITSGSLNKPYVSVKGFYGQNGLTLGADAKRDTISYCTFYTGGLTLDNSDYNVIYQNTFTGGGITICPNETTVCDGNFITNNKFWGMYQAGNIVKFGRGNDGTNYNHGYVDSLKFYFNRVNPVVPSNVSDNLGAVKYFFTTNSWFRGNYWDIKQNSNQIGDCPTGLAVWTWRDSTQNLRYDVDTIMVRGTKCQQMLLSSGNWPNSVKYMYPDSCHWQFNNGVFSFNQPMWNWNFTYNFLGFKDGIDIDATVDSASTFNHNTIVGNAGLGVFNFWGTEAAWPAGPTSMFTFTNNIVSQYNSPNEYTTCKQNSWIGNNDFGIFWGKPAQYAAAKITSNYNLVWTKSFTTEFTVGNPRGNRAVGWYNGTYACDSIGAGQKEDTDLNGVIIGGDSLSYHGNPFFNSGGVDTLLSDSYIFDPSLGLDPDGGYSAAVGNGSSGSDIGAIANVLVPKINLEKTSFRFECADSSCLTKSDSLYIKNTGVTSLIITSIASDNPVTTFSVSADTIAAGDSLMVVATYNSTLNDTNSYDGYILSNDPITPTKWFKLYYNIYARREE